MVTPLAVGAGTDNDWIKGLDFVQNGEKVYVIDIQKAKEQGVDIDKLTSLFLKYDYKGICDLLGNHLEQVSRLIFDAPVNTNNSIKSFIRTQLYGKPVVPGSSIKGAVRSALFNYLRENEEKNDEVFGNMNKGTDFMRFIRISDVEMPGTILVNSKIFNLQGIGNDWQGGWKNGQNNTKNEYRPERFNTLYECVAPGKKGYGSISLAGKSFELMLNNTVERISYREKKKGLMNGSAQDLFKIINHVTRNYLLKEKAFFEKYTADRSNELEDNIDFLLGLIPDDGSCCLLKMSAGVGFHSITGDWRFDDYDDTGMKKDPKNGGYKKQYKSRKTAEYNHQIQLMGFVKIRLMEEKEMEEKEQTLHEEHLQRLEQIIGPIRKREEERLQKLAEEQQRKEAAVAKRQKLEKYNLLLEQAKKAYNDSDWDAALTKVTEAANLYPERNEVAELKVNIQKAREIAAYRAQEKAAADQKFSQPLADVIKGKTSAGNLIGTMAKWLKAEGHSFGETEYDAFLQEARNLPSKEIKRKQKDLIKAIGEEQAQRVLLDLEEQ